MTRRGLDVLGTATMFAILTGSLAACGGSRLDDNNGQIVPLRVNNISSSTTRSPSSTSTPVAPSTSR